MVVLRIIEQSQYNSYLFCVFLPEKDLHDF